MAALVDTNVIVYRYDPRDPAKQKKAREVLRRGIAEAFIQIPYQAILEFVSVVTRPRHEGAGILSPPDAWREAEEMMDQFEVLYPDELVFRTAIHGAAAYQLSWFDAHLWAYAERYGLDTLLSEDFQHGRKYGTVRIVNPFL